MVFQKVYLFEDTIYNNIAMGRPDASFEEVAEAAKKARCYDFIMRLPYGFDTVVGEGGASLSGGVRRSASLLPAASSRMRPSSFSTRPRPAWTQITRSSSSRP